MNRRLLLTAIASGTLLNPLNSSMIAVALSRIQRDFGLSFTTASWLISSFYLASAVGHPVTGRLGDRFGARRTFLSGLALVAVACAVAPFARSFGLLVAARVLLALGTSTLFPAAMRVVGSLEDGRASALATVRAFSQGAATVGPALGGVLLWLGDWWLVFVVNLPIVAVSAALAAAALPADRPAVAESRSAHAWGAVFGSQALVAVYVQFALVNVVFYSIMFGVPAYLQDGGRVGASTAGIAMLALAACGILGTAVSVRAVPRAGLRPALAGAGMLSATGIVVLGVAGPGVGLPAIVAALALLGLGNGVQTMGLQAVLHAVAPREVLGAAAGVFMSARYVGAILAAALLGALFATSIGTSQLQTLALVLAAMSAAILSATAALRTT